MFLRTPVFLIFLRVGFQLFVSTKSNIFSLFNILLISNRNNILIDDAHFIGDESGNEQVIFQTTASAVNQFDITNAATGNNPSISATGDDSNISINLIPKGTGTVQAAGSTLATTGKAIAMAIVFG